MTNTLKWFLLAAVCGWALGPGPAAAGWVQVGGSLNANANGSAQNPSLALVNGTPYVAWHESVGVGPPQIYVKHWNLGSGMWVQDGGSLNLNANLWGQYPSCAASGTTPYVAWNEVTSSGYWRIYVKHFNGTAWIPDGGSLNVNNNQDANYPSLIIVQTTPFVAWQEITAGATQVYAKYFQAGAWFTAGGSVNVNGNEIAETPCLVSTGGTPYIAWHEYAGPVFQIYCKFYNGTAWVSIGGSLNVNSTQEAMWPTLAVAGTTPYVAWEEAPPPYQIYAKWYNGASWEALDGSLNLNANRAGYVPSLAVLGSTPYVAWYETGAAALQLYVKYFDGGSWIAVGGSLNVDTTWDAAYPSLAMTGTTPMVAWYESNSTLDQVVVKDFEYPATLTATPSPSATPGPQAQTSTPTVTTTPSLTPSAPSSTFTRTVTATAAQAGFFHILHARIRPSRYETAQFAVTLSKTSRVRLTAYDLTGRLIANVVDKSLAAGTYQFAWDGGEAGSGVYLVYFEADDLRGRGKVVVIR